MTATLLLFALMLVFRALSGFSGLYGQDAYEYTRFAGKIYSFFTTGAAPGDYFWPVLYPIAGAILNFPLQNIAFSLQLISITSFCFTFYFINKVIRIFNKSSHFKILIYTGVLFILSPIALRSAFLVMSDMLALMLITGAIFYSIKYYQDHTVFNLLTATFFTAAAVMTRYPAAVVLIIPAAVTAIAFIRHFTWKALPGILVISILVSLPHLLLRWDTPLAFASHEYLTNWSIVNFFQNDFSNNSGNFHYPIINLIHAFYVFIHPGFIFFGILLLPFISKKDFKKPVLLFILIPVLLYILFIAGLPYQNIRYLLLSFPLVLILLYPAFCRAIYFIQRKLPIQPVLIVLVIIQLILFYRAFQPFYTLNKLEQNIAGAMAQYPPKTIISFGMDVPLQYYLKAQEVINISEVSADKDYAGNYLLINDGIFVKQLENTVWGEKEQYLKQSYDLQIVDQFDEGWILYELKRN